MAGRGDAAETAQVLARAFYDDPVFGWMLPAEGSRHRRVRRFFVTELHHESLDLPKGAPVVNTMWRPDDLRDDAG